jgi:hypothetical protein
LGRSPVAARAEEDLAGRESGSAAP